MKKASSWFVAVIACGLGTGWPWLAGRAEDTPTLSLVAGRELPMFFASPVQSARVLGEDVAILSIDGKRLSIKGTRPGSTELEFYLAAESAPRHLRIEVSAPSTQHTAPIRQPGPGPALTISNTERSIPQTLAADASAEPILVQPEAAVAELQAPEPEPLATSSTPSISPANVSPSPALEPSPAPEKVLKTQQDPPPVSLSSFAAAEANASASLEALPAAQAEIKPVETLAYVAPPADLGLNGQQALSDNMPRSNTEPSSPALNLTPTPTEPPAAQPAVDAAQAAELAQGLTLLQAVNRGLAIHPEVQAASMNVERALTEISMAEGGYMPSLQLSSGIQDGNRLGYDVTLSQMLFDWGKVTSQVDVATATQRQKVETLLLTRSKAALEILEICLDMQTSRWQLEALQHYREYLQTLRQVVEQRSAGGYSDNSELGRIQQALGYVQEQTAIEQGKLRVAESQYRTLLDWPKNASLQVELPAHPDFFKRLLEGEALDTAIARSPTLRQSQQNVAMAQAKIDNAEAALKPRLQLDLISQRRPIGGQMTDDMIVALNMRMDPMQGLSAFQRITAEGQGLESAQFELNGVRRDLLREFKAFQENEAALWGRMAALDIQKTEVAGVRDIYREQFMAGLRTIDDLIRIERESYEANRQQITTRSEYERIPYRASARLGLLAHVLEARLEEGLTP